MNKRNHKIYLRDKQNLEARLERKQYPDQADPMFKDSNIHYEISERTRAIGCGGIGALHKLVCKLGLDAAINRNVMSAQDPRALLGIGSRVEHRLQRAHRRNVPGRYRAPAQ